jgi:hypothetical protein
LAQIHLVFSWRYHLSLMGEVFGLKSLLHQ